MERLLTAQKGLAKFERAQLGKTFAPSPIPLEQHVDEWKRMNDVRRKERTKC